MHETKVLLDSLSITAAHLHVDLEMLRAIEICHAVVPLLQSGVADIDLQGIYLRARVTRE